MNKFIYKIIGVLIYLTLGLQIICLFIFLTPAIANAQQTDSIKSDDGKDNKIPFSTGRSAPHGTAKTGLSLPYSYRARLSTIIIR